MFFGASFALRKSDYIKIGKLEKLIKNKNIIGLEAWPDDFWLSLKLQSLGRVILDRNSFVITYAKEQGLRESFSRLLRNMRDSKRLSKYFNNIN
ncbi:MAG: hypothetical protein R3B65_01740 [Candidatus Paceibacterota bacterium]